MPEKSDLTTASSNDKYRVVPLDSIQPHPRNYNTHPDEQVEQLASSVHTFAQVKNIVVWRGYIIAGEGLWRGMQRDGQTSVTIKDVSEWPEEKALAFMAADNELARMAMPDMGKLAENLKTIAAVNVDLAALAAGGDGRLSILTVEPEAYHDFNRQLEELSGMEEVNIVITIPFKYKEPVVEWLSNGEFKTSPGMGKGVLKRCGLLS